MAHIFIPSFHPEYSMQPCSSASCMNFLQLVILEMVMNMKNDREMLSSILKTTQMGQIGIRSVLDTSMRPGLRKALQSQLQEYDTIEAEAHALACQRGWELREIQPGKRLMSNMMAHMKLTRDVGGRHHNGVGLFLLAVFVLGVGGGVEVAAIHPELIGALLHLAGIIHLC